VFSWIAFTRRRDRYWALLALLSVGGLVLIFGTGRAQARVTLGPFEVAGLLLAAAAAAEAFGLPDPIAQRLGIGLRSREWEFDRSISDVLQSLNDLIDREPPHEDLGARAAWVRQLRRVGERRLSRLARLHPPDDRWAMLAGDYSQIYRKLIELHSGEEDHEAADRVAVRIRRATAQRDQLRAAYRADIEKRGSGCMARLLRGR
jgi:hypothetical protein